MRNYVGPTSSGSGFCCFVITVWTMDTHASESPRCDSIDHVSKLLFEACFACQAFLFLLFMIIPGCCLECITWQGAVTFLTLDWLCSPPPIYTRARFAYQCPSMPDMVLEYPLVKFILCSRSRIEQNRRTSRDRN